MLRRITKYSGYIAVVLTIMSCSNGGGSGDDAPNTGEEINYDKFAARLTTNFGEINIWPNFYDQDPSSISFARQIVNGVYDNTLLHRVIPGYIIQGGEFDINFNPADPIGSIIIDNELANPNNYWTIALTKTNSNNSPGFFFNLDNNNNLDPNPDGGYKVVGRLDDFSRTNETIRKILEIGREANAFEGPDASTIPTTRIKFSGNLSIGTSETTISDVTVYDINGDIRTLSIRFLNNLSYVLKEWLVTVTDTTNTINETFSLIFGNDGLISEGHGSYIVANPAVSGGASIPIEFYFGEPGTYFVTNFSGGTLSDIKINDVNGKPVPDGLEQPEQNIIIQDAQLLGRDRSLPDPEQTTSIVVAGNLEPDEVQIVNHEFEFYAGSLLISGIDEAGKDGLMRLTFTNQNNIQEGQWQLDVYWDNVQWGNSHQLQFDVSGSNTGVRTINLARLYMFNIQVNIGNLTSTDTDDNSDIYITSINGNSHWNQYVPITRSQFEYLVREGAL